MSVNVSYKHLDSKMKIAGLTVPYLGVLLAGAIGGLFYMVYIHPLSLVFTLTTGTYMGGLPGVAAFLFSAFEIDLVDEARARLRHTRSALTFAPGAGENATGYVVEDEPGEDGDEPSGGVPRLTLEALWES